MVTVTIRVEDGFNYYTIETSTGPDVANTTLNTQKNQIVYLAQSAAEKAVAALSHDPDA